MADPFRTVALAETPIWRKLVRRDADALAFSELVNLFAGAPDVTAVTERDVARIVQRHGRDPRLGPEARLRGLYADFLAHCLLDGHLDERELAALEHMRKLLRLGDSAVERAHMSVAYAVYGREVARAVEDGRVTDEERAFLAELEQRLRVPPDVAQRIYRQEARRRLDAALQEAARDELLSDEEDAELRTMARSLDIELSADARTRRAYDRLRLYWLIENGELTPIACLARLARGEICVGRRRAEWWEAGRANGTVGHDARAIARAVHLRPASVRRRLLGVQASRRLDAGRLYLTDRRLIFIGRSRSFQVALRHVTGYRPFADGIEVHTHQEPPPFLAFEKDVDLFALLLGRSLRQA